MAQAKAYDKHICCLEGDWTSDLSVKQSIRSALDFLEVNSNIKYIHKNCVTREQLSHYLKKYTLRKYATKYSICYLAFHGDPNLIYLGKEKVTLEDLAIIANGKFSNMIIHFGSCSTLKIDKNRIVKFLEATNALAVSGYTSDVAFLPSSIFDMLFFEMCQQYKNTYWIDKSMNKYYGNLIKQLGFRFIYR
ncbi:MAG: hypothetical protein M3Q58_03490 [Bacteroidota bacterium]|nr:hypothetical protein [Bacteroidota bacterium]